MTTPEPQRGACAPLDIAQYNNIVVLTGAGVSVASGLSTYRGPGGLWEKAEIARIADAANLPGTLPELWRLYSERRRQALAARPNPAPPATAGLQQRAAARGQMVTLITQNVDGLHQRAGSPEVIELHGSAFRSRCTNPDCALPAFPDEDLHPDAVPACPRCGAPLRPAVVLFGEPLSPTALLRVNEALFDCDLFLAAGTSGTVSPASHLVNRAGRSGARTILVNREPMPVACPAFREEYPGPVEEILPALLGGV
ncbi:MAG: NAD-dependent deacylase [Acetobacteraceae bacterium]|nr:NAD-dependent deacylase [Acetobacteraceae bacterium]